MSDKTKPSLDARRAFLGKLGVVATCTSAVAGIGALGAIQTAAAKSASSSGAAKSEPVPTGPKGASAEGNSFPTPDYDWTKHQWAFGVDATKCIGCLRCVEACKREN